MSEIKNLDTTETVFLSVNSTAELLHINIKIHRGSSRTYLLLRSDVYNSSELQQWSIKHHHTVGPTVVV